MTSLQKVSTLMMIVPLLLILLYVGCGSGDNEHVKAPETSEKTGTSSAFDGGP